MSVETNVLDEVFKYLHTTPYRDCKWYVRLWRCRWLLCVPFWAAWTWHRVRRDYPTIGDYLLGTDGDREDYDMVRSWDFAWSNAICDAEIRMAKLITLGEFLETHH